MRTATSYTLTPRGQRWQVLRSFKGFRGACRQHAGLSFSSSQILVSLPALFLIDVLRSRQRRAFHISSLFCIFYVRDNPIPCSITTVRIFEVQINDYIVNDPICSAFVLLPYLFERGIATTVLSRTSGPKGFPGSGGPVDLGFFLGIFFSHATELRLARIDYETATGDLNWYVWPG